MSAAARRRASASASSYVAPATSTLAPSAAIPARLNSGVCAETSTVASTPNVRDASATPRPWFPAEAAITRRRAPGSRLSAATRAAAPRSLNDPVRCRFSSFSQTSAPVRRPSDGAGTSGVTRVSRRTRLATSPPVTSRQISGSNIRSMESGADPTTTIGTLGGSRAPRDGLRPAKPSSVHAMVDRRRLAR